MTGSMSYVSSISLICAPKVIALFPLDKDSASEIIQRSIFVAFQYSPR